MAAEDLGPSGLTGDDGTHACRLTGASAEDVGLVAGVVHGAVVGDVHVDLERFRARERGPWVLRMQTLSVALATAVVLPWAILA